MKLLTYKEQKTPVKFTIRFKRVVHAHVKALGAGQRSTTQSINCRGVEDYLDGNSSKHMGSVARLSYHRGNPV